jgi:hypothetical protein
VIGDFNGSRRTKIGIFNQEGWLLDYNGNLHWDGTAVDRALVLFGR